MSCDLCACLEESRHKEPNNSILIIRNVLDRQIHGGESRVQLPGAGVVTDTQRVSVWKMVGFGFADNSVQAMHCKSEGELNCRNCFIPFSMWILGAAVRSAGLLASTFTTT